MYPQGIGPATPVPNLDQSGPAVIDATRPHQSSLGLINLRHPRLPNHGDHVATCYDLGLAGMSAVFHSTLSRDRFAL
jgi:hypothetical protein